jgi:hypothetical protein
LYLVIASTKAFNSSFCIELSFCKVNLSVLNPPSETSDANEGLTLNPASAFVSSYIIPVPPHELQGLKFL